MTRTTGTVFFESESSTETTCATLETNAKNHCFLSLGFLAEDGDGRARVSGGSHKHHRPQHLTTIELTIDDLGDLSAKVWLSSDILGFANDFMRYNLFENT